MTILLADSCYGIDDILYSGYNSYKDCVKAAMSDIVFSYGIAIQNGCNLSSWEQVFHRAIS